MDTITTTSGGEAGGSDMIDRREAARMFGVAACTWQQWERIGRVPRGTWAPRPSGKGGRRMVYPLAELERLLEQFRQLDQPYPDPDRPGCFRVPVMRYHEATREALIDAESLPLVAGRRWNFQPHKDGYHTVVLAQYPGPHTPLKRIILGLRGPRWRITHKNGDPLDCRRENLAVREMIHQAQNARKYGTKSGRKYSSRFKGVCWNTGRGHWQANIKAQGKNRLLGRFTDEIAAAQAYDEAAIKFFGEHARLNFPDGIDAWLEREAAAEDGTDQRDEHDQRDQRDERAAAA